VKKSAPIRRVAGYRQFGMTVMWRAVEGEERPGGLLRSRQKRTSGVTRWNRKLRIRSANWDKHLFFVSGVEDGVGNDEARYRCAADDVGVDDFVDVLGLDAAIPHGFGVHHYRGTQFTLVEASGFVGAHVFNTTLSKLGFEQAL
jgi:hypothetical protein